jgi:hypothetical protein
MLLNSSRAAINSAFLPTLPRECIKISTGCLHQLCLT